LRVNLGLA